MPWRAGYSTYKYVVIESDTRALELVMSTNSIWWAAWLLTINNSSTVTAYGFWAVTVMHNTHALLWPWAAFSGIFQITTIHFNRWRLKRWAAATTAAYWTYTCYIMWPIHYAFMFWMAALNTAVSLWILLHRTSTGT